MKKIISILLCLIMVLPTINLVLVSAIAESFSGKVVSNSTELKSAIYSAEENDIIYLKGGRYEFDSTFNIENIKKNLTICSVDGQTATFTTSYKVSGWEACTINGVHAFCADANGETITALFSDNVELQRARLPETGFYYVDENDTSDTVGDGDSMGSNGFYADDIDFNLENPEDICVGLLHWWVNELSPLVSFDASNGHFKTEKYTGLVVKTGDRYYLENVKESVDKAGEWCYDSSEDKIYYVPKDGETAENLCLYASSQAEMLKINNCSGITFKNIEFAETAFTYGDEKYLNTDIHTYERPWKNASFQSAVESTGAVVVTYSDNINFENCEFHNIGCTAIRYFNGAKNCTTENCVFDSIGASALFIGGKYSFYYPEQNDSKNYAENITVKNCEIKNYGQKFTGASGITLAYCVTADISHNEIHDGYYTGISVGYCWLYVDNPTENIAVKDNLIYNIGLDTMSDLGGIYLLGMQKNTVVSGNVIHDVTCYDGVNGYAGTGIYLDSGCEYMTIEKNLVFNCETSSFNNTLNKNNTIRNNIFAFAGQSSLCLGTEETGIFTNNNSTYYNNIILTRGDVPAIEYLKSKTHFCGTNNIIWNVDGDKIYVCKGHADGGKILWQTAVNNGWLDSAVFVDPGFTNASEYDFTFTDNSYATSHKFEAFDYNNAGTLSGTIIGFNTKGGQTTYNANVNEVNAKNIKLNFFEKIKEKFNVVVDFFKLLIKRMHGLAQSVTDSNFYQTYFEKRTDNGYTLQLEQLFDKVKQHNPTYRVDETRKPFSDDDRISAIYFDGEDYNGKSTEIFAYLGIPEGASAMNPVPAVVLVHGGGLYAQADWVQYWVDRGYAAIAIDGFGEEPLVGEYVSNNTNWVANPNSHMGYRGFDDSDNKLTDQWFYYFITDIILANNIMRNDERIVTNEIGVAGISWGGIATSVAMGYDERFAFAIPIYGCPYSADSSGYVDTIFNEKAKEIWEPSLRLSRVNMPVLLVNGDNDFAFSLDCTTTSASYLKQGNLVIINELFHGKFKIEETVRFANEVTGSGEGNIHITGVKIDGNQAYISFTLPSDAKNVKVKIYTKKNGFEYENLKLAEPFEAKRATVCGTNAKVTIPDDTKYYYIAVTANCGNIFTRNIITASTGVYTAN